MSPYHRPGDPECAHGFPIRALISGLPYCPLCRRAHKRNATDRERNRRLAGTTTPSPAPDHASLAAHDTDLFGEDTPA